MLSFLSDPIGYKPGDRCLEIPDLRKAIEKKCRQLFIEEVQETEEETEVTEVSRREDSMDTNSMEEELSYAEKLAKEFDADLKNMVGTSKMPEVLAHIEEEINLVSKTGQLTAKLKQLLRSLEGIPAASIESERAFSVASRFVTKIRSRLGDKHLDNFLFAKSWFKNQLVIIIFHYFFIYFVFSNNRPLGIYQIGVAELGHFGCSIFDFKFPTKALSFSVFGSGSALWGASWICIRMERWGSGSAWRDADPDPYGASSGTG